MDFFDEYANRYDMSVSEINYKYYHSYRVMDAMVTLAKSMNMTKEDIELAKCIGLLHDIGRFEQLKQFGDFKDCNLDHADYGVEVLKKENGLKHFDIKESDYEVVYKAIENHNKYAIEPNLNKRTLLYSKMIRDADKLDILYAIGNEKIKSIIREDDSTIDKRITEEFFKNKQVEKTDKETKNENIVMMFSFIYDFNFNASLAIVKKEKYYQKIYERLTHKELFKPYIEHVIKYIDERID